jgi:hypothetical protein
MGNPLPHLLRAEETTMEKLDRSRLAGQANRLGRRITGVVIGSGQQAVTGAREFSHLVAECAAEFLAGVRAQKVEMTGKQPLER